MEYFLAVDCGLTVVKAAIFSDTGEKISIADTRTPVFGERVDTGALYDALCRVVRKALTALPAGGHIARMCAAGHGNGLYYILRDGRSGGLSSMAPGNPGGDAALYRLTLQSSWSGQPLRILRALKRTDPDTYDNITNFMFCKDFIAYKLTGNIGTDYSDASAGALLSVETGDYDRRIFEYNGVAEKFEARPPLFSHTDTGGAVTPQAARDTGLAEGTPVCAGLFDVNACNLGAGSYPDSYNLIAGTWGINSVRTGKPVDCPEVTQACLYLKPPVYMLIDSAPVSCGNLEWLLTNVFQDIRPRQADELVADTPCDPDLLYYPYLYPPMDMPQARAEFRGLCHRHGYRDMIRAVFEGVVYEHRRRIEKFRTAGLHRSRAVLCGGAVKSKVWCQMFADITGLIIEGAAQTQAGLLGCAVTAAVSAGVYPDIETACGRMVKRGPLYYPRQDALYTQKYNRFLEGLSPWITD